MKVKVIVELTTEEEAKLHESNFYKDWDTESILFERISESYDDYMQDIEVRIVE